MHDHSEELAFAHDLALLGGKIASGHYRRNPKSERKHDGTWVTEADWAVEAQIRLRIARSFPDHNVLGEEEGLTGAGGGAARPGAPTWIVDPIDGTHNYIAGIPVWATLIALRVGESNVLGVCHAPLLNETYAAALGSGATFNGEAIRVDPIDDLSQATVLDGGANRFEKVGLGPLHADVSSTCRRTRGFGDFWGHMLVARGAAHVMYEPQLSAWDVAALEPIVAEAGGRLSHIDGSPWKKAGSCLTTNGELHEEIIRRLHETCPGWAETTEP